MSTGGGYETYFNYDEYIPEDNESDDTQTHQPADSTEQATPLMRNKAEINVEAESDGLPAQVTGIQRSMTVDGPLHRNLRNSVSFSLKECSNIYSVLLECHLNVALC